ncbi:hypothetical protein [Secundilactobacillus odoratitofui]|uniref:hypothetical protein n=1 Tax=Secundilactobacillus odoratitofui TaxID=480930 RepID=UPI0006D12BA8|nr:hypothetical protein [Secundilactobacillus odoratitofui]
MLFREPTLTELIATYTNLLRNSRLFLKDTHQIEVVFQLTDFANNHKIEVRNGQLKQASQLRIRKGVAAISVTYHGTQLKTYHGFDITDQRFKPKYFVGWVGNQKND